MIQFMGMDLSYAQLGGFAAGLLFLAVLLFMAFLRRATDTKAKAVRERLDALSMAQAGAQPVDIVRRESLSDVPLLNRTLSRTNWARKLSKLIYMADAPGRPGVYVLLAALLAIIGFYVSILLLDNYLLMAALTVGPGALPFLWLRRKKNKRMGRFQAQLADALELISRAMQAGHSFFGGLRMVVDECENPIAKEFGLALDEINFGVGLEEALGNLLSRVDCSDLKFFVVSVIVQRETGGNLAEIIGNIAHLVRERFKLLGRIDVLSAEGRLSAWILMALPFCVAALLFIMNPEYMQTLLDEKIGNWLIQGALVQMGIGFFAIRRLIKIKV